MIHNLHGLEKVMSPEMASIFGRRVVDVYFMGAEGLQMVKIGCTQEGRLEQRIKSLQTGSPVKLFPILLIPGAGEDFEKSLHARFAKYRSHLEWFFLSEEIQNFIDEQKSTQ